MGRKNKKTPCYSGQCGGKKTLTSQRGHCKVCGRAKLRKRKLKK